MPVTTFPVRFPTSMIPDTAVRVTQLLALWEDAGDPIVAKYLAWVGEPNTGALTGEQKVELYCARCLWKARRDDYVQGQVESALQAATQSLEDEFDLS